MSEWLEKRADALGVEPPTGDEVALLLSLAGDAAHESGARTNAPLLCYLLGRAQAAGDRSLADVAEIVKSTS